MSPARFSLSDMLAHPDENQDCRRNPCPVEDSIYGYQPNLGAMIFFLAAFAISGLAYVGQGIRTKTQFFTWAMCFGAVSELLGYVAELLLWQDPFSDAGFKMSVILLTFAPAFYAGGLYYTLKHICLTCHPFLSRLPPALYTSILISSDIFSILLQAVGGALSSVAATSSILAIGRDVMIAWLLQVSTLVVLGLLAADYVWSVYRYRSTALDLEAAVLRQSRRVKLFIAALELAYFCILLRCTHRVAELAGGEYFFLPGKKLFIGLDSVPIAFAAVVLNIWHPADCFPRAVQLEDQKLARHRSEEEGEEGVQA